MGNVLGGRSLGWHLVRMVLGMVFDAQALLKNQKVASPVVLGGAFLGGIGTLLFNEYWYFLKMMVSFLSY